MPMLGAGKVNNNGAWDAQIKKSQAMTPGLSDPDARDPVCRLPQTLPGIPAGQGVN
jgi:hypothetical protein